MRELFPGFYKRTDKELSECWEEGIFVFDTNMLLNVYRYASETRDRYFEILDILKKRSQLWIPYQAAYEYQDRRIDVIRGQLEPYKKVESILQKTWQALDNSLEPYKSKHGIIDTTDLAVQLTGAIKSAKDTITTGNDKYNQYKQENVAFNKQDTLQEKLEELFQGNIGSPYTSSRLEELYKRAQLRMELRIPPGWEDEGKHTFKAYGDIVLWFQLIDYARTQKKPMVFVTDDGKKDWWIRNDKGKPIQPLPALIQEMFVEAEVLLHLYLGYEFLEKAEHFLKLEEKPDVIEEAREVTQQNIVKNTYQATIALIAYQAEIAVYEWLNSEYPQSEIIQSAHQSPDFIVLEPSGTRTGFEVKYFAKLNESLVRARLLSTIEKFTGDKLNINRLNIVIVSSDEEDAIKIIEIIETSSINLPESVLVIGGYLDQDNHFQLVARLPD